MNAETRFLIILPTYNEKENLRTLVPALLDQYPETNILIIDDNSPDKTGILADKLVSFYPSKVFVLHRPEKQGLGTAYKAGFKFAFEQDYDYIITMDSDWSHHPQAISLFIKEIKNTDLVVGSRYIQHGKIKNWSFLRLLLSKAGNYYIRLITKLPIKDIHQDFNVLKRLRLKQLSPWI